MRMMAPWGGDPSLYYQLTMSEMAQLESLLLAEFVWILTIFVITVTAAWFNKYYEPVEVGNSPFLRDIRFRRRRRG